MDLVFGNVRDATWLTDDHFRARAGHLAVRGRLSRSTTPGTLAREDLARLDQIVEARTAGAGHRLAAPFPVRGPDAGRAASWSSSTGCSRGTGDRWRQNADHLSEVDRAQARAILESQRTALREALRRAVQECLRCRQRRRRARSPRTRRTTGCWSAWTRASCPAAPGGRRPGRGVRQPGGPGVQRDLPGAPRFEPGDNEVTVRDLAAVYSHVERAVADPEGRVRLDGDVAAVRRVANALRRRQAGETHFLFGDDRFTPWATEFERAAARDGLRPEDTVTVGAAAEVDRCDDAAVRACGTRSQTSSSSPGRRCGTGAWYDTGRAGAAAAAGRCAPGYGAAARAAARPRRLEEGD